MKRARRAASKARRAPAAEEEELSPEFFDRFDDTLGVDDIGALSKDDGREREGCQVKKKKGSRWHRVSIPDTFFNGNEYGGFCGLEVLDDVDDVDIKQKDDNQDDVVVKEEEDVDDDDDDIKQKDDNQDDVVVKEEEDVDDDDDIKQKDDNQDDVVVKEDDDNDDNIKQKDDEWNNMGIDKEILKSIHEDFKFSKPTRVQQEVIPAAICAGKDIVAAAETGSGKTLAYGIPMVQGIVHGKGSGANDGVRGLVLTPTRELAMQVCGEIARLVRGLGVRVAPIVGGMSMAKQERVLRQAPEIVVATTGRFWELCSGQANAYLGDMSKLQFFVLDEADRMIEVGHFKELGLITEMIRKQAARKIQTFILSATLAVTSSRQRLLGGKRAQPAAGGEQTPLDRVIEAVEFRRPVQVVDLTNVHVTATGLSEYKLLCPDEDKDLHLFAILHAVATVPELRGRAIVFANSISMVRRLVSLLRQLGVCTTRLHAGMQQRQRLRALDHFRAHDSCVLVASDVAARGIDIPDVSYVLHYGAPRSSDVYVHRAGRTARAGRPGVSVCIAGPEDVARLGSICLALKRADLDSYRGLPSLAMSNPDPDARARAAQARLPPTAEISQVVSTARRLDRELRLAAADVSKRRWLVDAARSLDVDAAEYVQAEEEEEEDGEPEEKRPREKKKAGSMLSRLRVRDEVDDMRLVRDVAGEDDDRSTRMDDDDIAARQCSLRDWKAMVAQLKERLAKQLAVLSTPGLTEVVSAVAHSGGFGKRAVPIGSGIDSSTLDRAIEAARATRKKMDLLRHKHAKQAQAAAGRAVPDPDSQRIRPRSRNNKHCRRRHIHL